MSRSLRVLISAMAVLLLVAGVVLINRSRPTRRSPLPVPLTESRAVTPLTNQETKLGNASNKLQESTQESRVGIRIREFIASKRIDENGPVEFHGRVIDQSGQSVPGVRIRVTYRFYVGTVFLGNAAADHRWEQKELEIFTDQGGQFSLAGFEAATVDLTAFEKTGYTLGEGQRRVFDFAPKKQAERPVTGPTKPLCFYMWKSGQKEPLLYIEKRLMIRELGRRVLVDILQGEVLSGEESAVDLIIEVTGDKHPEVTWALSSWQMKISARQGGLLETEDMFMKLAPSGGYHDALLYNPEITSSWPGGSEWGGKRKYFFTGRNGRLIGALQAEIEVGRNGEARFQYRGYFNAAGSRNLEPDPEKLITDPEEIRRIDEQVQVK